MSVRWTMRAAAVYVVVSEGCAQPSDEEPADTWVDTDAPPTSDSGGASDDDGGGSSGAAGEVYGLWLVEGTVVPGTSFAGSGEFAAYDDTDTDHCILVWEFTAATPSTDCTECEFAFELTLGAVEVDFELSDGACDDWAELAVEGQVMTVGYGASGVYQRQDTTWAAVGEGEFTTDSGQFYGEIELE